MDNVDKPEKITRLTGLVSQNTGRGHDFIYHTRLSQILDYNKRQTGVLPLIMI